MKMKELVEEVSKCSGVGPGQVRKVLDATFATVAKQMAADDAVRLQGFGTFMRREGKNGGQSRIVFRQWLTKDEKQAKKKEKKSQETTVPI